MKRNIITFADAEIKMRLLKSNHTLFRIEKIVDWNSINKILLETDYRLHNNSGRDNYDPTMMFRILLVQRIYDLADRQIENELMYNLAYIQFCGLSIDHPIPDHSTISRWRQRFIDFGIYQDLFDDFNRQLVAQGYNIAKGVIVDATLVEAYSRPNQKTLIDVEPTGDAELKEQDLITTDKLTKTTTVTKTESTSNDPDAKWIKKGKRSIYGYKFHAAVNTDGLFLACETTPANVYDGNMFESLLDNVVQSKAYTENIEKQQSSHRRTVVLGDKGYDSEKNRNYLKDINLSDGIMRKKPKQADFSETQRARNKTISKIRYKVERSFGLLKRKFKNHKTKYIGQKKTHNYNLLGAFAHNLIRCLSL